VAVESVCCFSDDFEGGDPLDCLRIAAVDDELLSWTNLEGEMEDGERPGIICIFFGGVLAIGEFRSCIRNALSYTIRVPPGVVE